MDTKHKTNIVIGVIGGIIGITGILLLVLWLTNVLVPRYKCNNKQQCVGYFNGKYKKKDCDSKCANLTYSYTCENGACTKKTGSSGEYKNNTCGDGCYKCTGKVCGKVTDHQTDGTHQQSDCDGKCDVSYSCVGGACKVTPGAGEFPTNTCGDGCYKCTGKVCGKVMDHQTDGTHQQIDCDGQCDVSPPDACEGVTCDNHGVCSTVAGGVALCKCDVGYYRSAAQSCTACTAKCPPGASIKSPCTPTGDTVCVTSCDDIDCDNHGTCSYYPPHCICLPGYTQSGPLNCKACTSMCTYPNMFQMNCMCTSPDPTELPKFQSNPTDIKMFYTESLCSYVLAVKIGKMKWEVYVVPPETPILPPTNRLIMKHTAGKYPDTYEYDATVLMDTKSNTGSFMTTLSQANAKINNGDTTLKFSGNMTLTDKSITIKSNVNPCGLVNGNLRVEITASV